MENSISRFRPSTSWITTALLTLVVATFGIFAQTHASEREVSFVEVSSSITAHAGQLMSSCNDQLDSRANIILYH